MLVSIRGLRAHLHCILERKFVCERMRTSTVSCSCRLLTLVILLSSSLTASLGFGNVKNFDNKEWIRVQPKSLHGKRSLCEDGKKQSPIDVEFHDSQVNQSLGSLEMRFYTCKATMKNKGYEIRVEWIDGGGSLMINDKSYILQQCHWHSPSEHTYNGVRYPLEMHMVHKSFDEEIAVIGILYTFGAPDSFLSPELMMSLGKLVKIGAHEVDLGPVRPPLIEMGAPYFRYSGSLTTPPCTEGVIWSLVREVKTVSKEQVDLLRLALHNESNARPIQPINGRTVYVYKPRKFEDRAST